MEHLDDDWKVVQKFSRDGLVLDAGDELLLEGAMADATDIGDLLELELPAKLVFRKAMKQSGDEATTVTKTGHTVTTVTTSKTTKSVKSIKSHSHEELDKMSEDEYYKHLDKVAKGEEEMGKGDDEYYHNNDINVNAEDD